MTATVRAPLLQLTGISKSFGASRALVSADLELRAGSITALLGENGAGKSTLVKILSGVLQPDSGQITISGEAMRIDSPQHAQQLGISVIHQEAVVFDRLSVAENIFVTAPLRRFRMLNWPLMRREAVRLMELLGFSVDPDALVRELSVAQQHLVQIARAISHDARIVIMDEPTASLSHRETQDLLQIARRLSNEGRALLYISHKFDEIFAIADRYTVLRDGSSVDHGLLQEANYDMLVNQMVGRSVEQLYPKCDVALGEEVLRVEGLARAGEYADVSFSVRRSEILGVYGLVGAGRSEVMLSIFGLNPADSGSIVLDKVEVSPHCPADAIAHRIAYVPEDRQHQGAVLQLSIGSNITLPSLSAFSRFGWLNGKKATEAAEEWSRRMRVKCMSTEQELAALSGGNQQKVVLAKWMLTAPKVLLLDEPTKGVDVASKSALHALMGELVRQGMAIVMVSSELPEILGLSDRVLVMRRGRIVGLLDRRDADPETVLRLASDER
jgi:rhamnose transport system ATP-binding protein